MAIRRKNPYKEVPLSTQIFLQIKNCQHANERPLIEANPTEFILNCHCMMQSDVHYF